MAKARILSSKRKFYTRVFRLYTRKIRFLLHLIKLQLRYWISPVWPLPAIVMDEDYPECPWAPKLENAKALIKGEFCPDMGGDEYEDFWICIKDLSRTVQRQMHDFQWLKDLSIYEDKDEAAEFSRRLIDQWHYYKDEHNSVAHEVTVRAERLSYCLSYNDIIAHNASQKWLRRQRRYYYAEIILLTDLLRRKEHYAGFSTLKALLFASLIFPSMQFLQRPVNRMLHQAMSVRFFSDGGHRTRSPEFHRWDIATLLELRAVLKQKQLHITPEFDEIMQRGLDALATFTHGDNKLACFHDSIEQPVDKFINLWQIWRKPKPLAQQTLPKTGFVHLKRDDSTIIFDVGYKPSSKLHHHASPLSFEFSRIGSRMIVNCGAYRGMEKAWRKASYSTAAHSTLCIDTTDAWDGDKSEAGFKVGHCSVEEGDAQVNVIAEHFGYVDSYGIIHEREIALSADGKIIRGEDRIRHSERQVAYAAREAENIHIRFHLHPTVSIEKITPQAVVLRLKNDELWNFSLEGENKVPSVEESIYLGEDGFPKQTMQLVITAPMDDESDIEEERIFAWNLTLNKG